jgi:hypothetical protein
MSPESVYIISRVLATEVVDIIEEIERRRRGIFLTFPIYPPSMNIGVRINMYTERHFYENLVAEFPIAVQQTRISG